MTNTEALKAVYEALGGDTELVNPSNLDVLNAIAELNGGTAQTSNAKAIKEIADNPPSGGAVEKESGTFETNGTNDITVYFTNPHDKRPSVVAFARDSYADTYSDNEGGALLYSIVDVASMCGVSGVPKNDYLIIGVAGRLDKTSSSSPVSAGIIVSNTEADGTLATDHAVLRCGGANQAYTSGVWVAYWL